MTADVFPAAPRTADSDVPPAPEEAPPPHFRRDLLFLLLVALATFAFASAVELNEWLSAHTKPLERYQLDEVPVTILMVLIVVINFLWQRGRRLTREYS